MRHITIAFFIISLMFVGGCEMKRNKNSDEKSVGSSIRESKKDSERQYINKYTDTTAQKEFKEEKVDTFPYFADYQGFRYYFPCGPCRDRFIKDPEKYLEKKRNAGAKVKHRKL